MRPILAGLDTEYGFSVEGHGAEDQIDDAKALVRSYPGERLSMWDDSSESPRSDLRGFRLESLAYDPEDAVFDEGRSHGSAADVRSDQILPNGARFYNDHGHPEYATPECWGLEHLAQHDKTGDEVVLAAASAFEQAEGREVRVYKNNTDFHGASYGSHESYLVPRKVPVDDLIRNLTPLLVARQVLCGSGKVGAEKGRRCDFQISQRADFFMEPVNAETLYRRPVFNTRDEPHADPRRWMRLHVICGESNMLSSATRRKVALVKAALLLIEHGECPEWSLRDPVRSFKAVSREPDDEGRIELHGRSWTTPRQVVESFTTAVRPILADLPEQYGREMAGTLDECERLLEQRFSEPEAFARHVDWAAKRSMLEQFREQEGLNWRAPALQSLDLEYHRIDKGEGLFPALIEVGAVEEPQTKEVKPEHTRAYARSIAFRKFKDSIATMSWGSIVFKTDQGAKKVALPPDKRYPESLERCANVEDFIMEIEALNDD